MHVDPQTVAGPRTFPPDEHWYVLEAKPGLVEQAYMRLAVTGLHVKMFLIAKRAPNRRGNKGDPKVKSREKRSDTYMPRFGRYFFVRCRLNDSIWAGIHMTPGVRGILRSSKEDLPVPIPDEIIEDLESRGNETAARIDQALFVVGDVVTITEGPFATFQGVVQELDGSEVLILDVSIFGRACRYPLRFNQVEMLQPAKSRAISAIRKAKEKNSSAKVRSHA